MATNPLYNTNNSPNNSTNPTKAVNRQGVRIKRTHNTFDNSYFHYKTQKFGQYEPFFVMEATEGDMIPLVSSHDVRSLPFATPFLSSLTLNKDFFLVPHQAIQPNTWEYIYKHPAQGDDVPADVINVLPFQVLDTLSRNLENVSYDSISFLWVLLTSELFFSSGSLLYNLGYKINPEIVLSNDGVVYSFDSFFDAFVRSISSINILDSESNISYVYDSSYNNASPFDGDTRFVSMAVILSLLRRHGSRFLIQDIMIDAEFSDIKVRFPGISYDDTGSSLDINMDRVLAYQLACSQFFVNPQVDFIYNAQLYRDNFITLAKSVDSQFTIDFFTYNGIQVPYDYFSKHYYLKIFQQSLSASDLPFRFDFYNYLFGYREQLRFGDYFVDSRTQPLAIGDNSVAVNNDSVSVIDLNKSLILQRFRNAVVKMGNAYDDYLNKLFGTSPAPDYHIPKFIIHDESVVKSFEVADTTEANLGNLSTNLKSEGSSKQFEITIDMACIVIGISHFTVPRVYCQTKDKFFFFNDRFDYFNPMLQYLGDQSVLSSELSERLPGYIFSYQSRNGEYKQRFSVASGAFVEKLPAWSFVTDSPFGANKDLLLVDHQSPDYIRSYDFEFNRFFKSISGYSLANSFHFIVVYNNKCVCNRPMEVNPNTL